MEKILYLDCFSGASGDMVLGALIDLGVPLDGLRTALAALLPAGCELTAERVSRSGIGAIQFDVKEVHHDGGGHARHRGLHEILELVAPLARAGRRLQPGRSEEHRRRRVVLLLRDQLGARQRNPARAMRRVQLRGGARWPATRGVLA